MNSSTSPDPNEAVQALILDIFRERHRHDTSLRDDVFRTLPFFATALGVVIATVGAIASRLPPADRIRASWLLTAVAAALGLALLKALVVLLMLAASPRPPSMTNCRPKRRSWRRTATRGDRRRPPRPRHSATT